MPIEGAIHLRSHSIPLRNPMSCYVSMCVPWTMPLKHCIHFVQIIPIAIICHEINHLSSLVFRKQNHFIKSNQQHVKISAVKEWNANYINTQSRNYIRGFISVQFPWQHNCLHMTTSRMYKQWLSR